MITTYANNFVKDRSCQKVINREYRFPTLPSLNLGWRVLKNSKAMFTNIAVSKNWSPDSASILIVVPAVSIHKKKKA